MDASVSPFLIFILAVIILGIVAYYNYRMNEARKEDIFALSCKYGLNFDIEDPCHILSIYSSFDSIDKGYDQKAYNVISGRLGNYEIRAFDYRYTTGSGKSRQTHHMSFIAMDTDVCFQGLTIRPEGVFDRIAGAFGFDDIDFESDEFSRKFHVTSQDKQFAYEVVHPRMMEFLLLNPLWSTQLLGRTVMISNQRLLDPVHYERGIKFIQDFLGLVPDFVWQKLRDPREVR